MSHSIYYNVTYLIRLNNNNYLYKEAFYIYSLLFILGIYYAVPVV